MHAIQSELLKYKRTFTKKLIVLISLFFVLYSLVIRLLLPAFLHSWQGLISLVFNWWSFIFLPFGMGIFAVLVAIQEKKAGNYRTLRTHNISPFVIWLSKITVMALYSLLSSLVLAVSVIVSGLLTSGGTIPISQIFAGNLVCWLSSLVLIPIQLWAATWKGVFLSIAIAFAGMLSGVVTAPSGFWYLLPWSYPMRLMCPIIGIHPNGTLLPSESPLLDTTVVPFGLLLSVGAFLIITIVTGVWFKRREV